jgi:regulator of nucleoside diphosphate kinase
MNRATRKNAAPSLIIDLAQYHRLVGLAEANDTAVAKRLLDEIERAELKKTEEIPRGVVTIGSDVTYTDSRVGRDHTVRVCYPEHADVGAARVSVLSPIGAALIGLSEGQSIEWAMPDGRTTELTVVSVAQPAPRAGSGE